MPTKHIYLSLYKVIYVLYCRRIGEYMRSMMADGWIFSATLAIHTVLSIDTWYSTGLLKYYSSWGFTVLHSDPLVWFESERSRIRTHDASSSLKRMESRNFHPSIWRASCFASVDLEKKVDFILVRIFVFFSVSRNNSKHLLFVFSHIFSFAKRTKLGETVNCFVQFRV